MRPTRWSVVIAVLALFPACSDGDEDRAPQGGAPTQPPGQAAPSPAVDSCTLLSTDAVGAALGVPGSAVTTAKPSLGPGAGDSCSFNRPGASQMLFLVQLQDLREPARARQLVERGTGNPVPAVGDVAKYEQTPVGPTKLSLAKGPRVVFLTSQAQPVAQPTMVDLGKQAAAKL